MHYCMYIISYRKAKYMFNFQSFSEIEYSELKCEIREIRNLQIFREPMKIFEKF